MTNLTQRSFVLVLLHIFGAQEIYLTDEDKEAVIGLLFDKELGIKI